MPSDIQTARVAAALVPLLLLAVVFPLNWVVGVLLVLCLPLAPLNLSLVGMGTATVARRHGEELRYLSGYVLDRLHGLATLRALGADRAELARVRVASRRLANSSMAVLRVAFVSAAALEAIVTISIGVAAIYIGLTLLGYMDVPGLPNQMSLCTGLFLLMITPLYFQPMRSLAAAYHERADALAAAQALAPLLTTRAATRTAQPPAGPPSIELAHLTVRFDSRELPALDDVSLAVEPGELIGITGASGAGKSTLLRILAGDLEPSSGTATIAGVAATTIPRTSATWLGQRPYLFPGTLADNIALGRPDAPEQEVLDAAHRAGLDQVLARLPGGSTLHSASMAGACPVVKPTGSLWRGPSSATRRCSCSTSRPLISMPPVRRTSSRSSRVSPGRRRPLSPPIRLSCSTHAIEFWCSTAVA